MNATASTRLTRPVEWVLLIAIVLIAIVFRFAQLGQVPPGLHYDEAIDARLAQEIRAGARPIYFEEGWGREPLYHYLVAATLVVAPEPATALRLVSSVLGLIQLLAAYFLFKRLFGVPTALIGAAWIAVLFWTVSTSRAGVRNVTLTTLATLTALAFWSAWNSRPISNFKFQISNFILPGLLLGLTLYTYQPSRVVPIMYLAFVAYVALTDRPALKARRKGLLVFFGAAAIVALPLGVLLFTHPGAETERAFQTEPIRALLSGDPGQIVDTSLATLKMFTFEGGGDPQPIYNVPGRPLFVGAGAVLFVLGLLVCFARWRRPPYAFVLIWLIVTLLPNMLTAPAPFFYRAIAAQTAVAAMPAIGTVAIGDFVNRRGRRGRRESHEAPRALRPAWLISVTLVAIVSVGQTALATQRDYFDVWGKDPAVRFQYSETHTAIARALDASPDTTAVAISGIFVEDADPYIFEQTLRRDDLLLRWFDARSALVAVGAVAEQRLALPSFTPLDKALAARFMSGVEPIAQTDEFAIYPFDIQAFRGEVDGWQGAATASNGSEARLPISFAGDVQLLGYERPDPTSRSESELVLLTAWRVTGEAQPSPATIFAHLLDADGSLVAQDDRLGFPRHNWQAGDEFVQVHRVPIGSLQPGRYTLQIGVYDRDGVRWPAQDALGRMLGDRALLGEIEVTP
jgi:4-amino-4-deoxy-L-arabinose transferase-like glycosyltransferase